MNKNKFYKIVMFIIVGVFLVLSTSYSQYKQNTLVNILPGADILHADRFFESYVSPTNASTSELKSIVGPYPWKMKIKGAWFRQIGISPGGDSTNDSVKVILVAGKGITVTSDSLVGDTLIMNRIAGSTDSTDTPFDSTYQAFTFDNVNNTNNYGPIDTLMPGYVLSLKEYSGVPDSAAVAVKMYHINFTVELEILE